MINLMNYLINIDCKDKKSYDKNNSEITQEETDKK